MSQTGDVTIKQAIEMAQNGNKKEAYTELIKLSKVAGGKNPNLLLWIAFTTPDLDEAEAALNMVESLDPANPNLTGAREWYKTALKQREEIKKSPNLPGNSSSQSNPSQPLPFPTFSSPAASSAPTPEKIPANPYSSPTSRQTTPDSAASSASPSPAPTPTSTPTAQGLPYSQPPVSQPPSQPLSAAVFPPAAAWFPTISRSQGFVLIGLLAFILFFSLWNSFKPEPKWEYKTVTFLTSGNEREGLQAFNYSSIKLDQKQLASLGGEGWELVTDYLEMETAFPNFGASNLVTGLQPNIRPQSLVLIFKRKV